MYYVYQHINKINNKRYIGITKQNPSLRWGSNGINYKGSPVFWNALQKYGWNNFEHEILYSNLSKEDACHIEKKLIMEYKTQDRNFGYNITEGGDAPSMTPETKEKISSALKGNKNNAGNKCSELTKKKIIKDLKGKPFTKEHKQKISIAKKGKSTGKHSEETIRKISKAHKKKAVYCKEQNIVYESIQQCAKMINVPATNVCKCCKGKIKTVKGYHLSYYNND